MPSRTSSYGRRSSGATPSKGDASPQRLRGEEAVVVAGVVAPYGGLRDRLFGFQGGEEGAGGGGVGQRCGDDAAEVRYVCLGDGQDGGG